MIYKMGKPITGEKSKKPHKKYKKNRPEWTLERVLQSLITSGGNPIYDRSGLSVEDLMGLWKAQDGRCALTGVPMTFVRGSGKVRTNVSLDRLEVGGPYILENVRLVCYQVNLMRHTMSDEELIWWCKKLVEGL